MAYGFYITRKEDWSDIDGPAISVADWLNCVASAPDLELDAEHAAAVDPRVASGAKEPTHVIWTAWEARTPGVDEAWMWLEQGNVVASDADGSFRRKLYAIAQTLGASLQGDDGETYGAHGEPGVVGPKRPWWKFW